MLRIHGIFLVLAACEPAATLAADSAVAPPLRNPVTLADAPLAMAALDAMRDCASCHGFTRQQLRNWAALTDAALSTCLTGDRIDCMRTMPDTPGSDFSASRLGIYAAATHLPWFAYVFDRTLGVNAPSELARLQAQAGMPRGDHSPLTQDQLDLVAEWFARGLPHLDELLSTDPPPSSCTPNITPAVAAHVAAMQTTGWAALNRASMMAMYGCGSATDAHDCLATLPSADNLAAVGTLRVLRDVTYTTQFWTRSSPDGRFVAHGVSNVVGSILEDLQRGVGIAVAGDYDPAFFPDNSGFSFQGASNNTCAMSVLTSNPTSVSMHEPGCTDITTLGQYQHMARALDGGDYLAVDSQYVSDDGGKLSPSLDPAAHFTATATINITPMLFDGTKFVAKPRIRVPSPFEGDVVLSPSGRLALTRVAGLDDVQLGYTLHAIDPATYALTELARYCLAGGKPAFSYDERYAVFHHYEGDRANIYLLELATGVVTQVTRVEPNQYALYPHFRSDGWIYFQVRSPDSGHELTLASDAGL